MNNFIKLGDSEKETQKTIESTDNQTHETQSKKKNSRKEFKDPGYVFIYFTLAFDMRDLHSLFNKFYLEYEQDENMTLDEKEMKNLIESITDIEIFGERSMKRVFDTIGIVQGNALAGLFKEGHHSTGHFEPELYEDIFSKMSQGQKEVRFH